MTEQHTHDIESDAPNVDAGGKAHTSTTEPHPAGDGERTDRQVGGPVADTDDDSDQSESSPSSPTSLSQVCAFWFNTASSPVKMRIPIAISTAPLTAVMIT